MKYLAVTCVFLALCVIILFNMYKDSRDEINTLKNEKKALVINNERLVKNEVELRKQKAEVKKAVDAEKLNFDWSYNLSDSPVRKRLSDNCLSCSRRAD